jgi:hypothetical protein
VTAFPQGGGGGGAEEGLQEGLRAGKGGGGGGTALLLERYLEAAEDLWLGEGGKDANLGFVFGLTRDLGRGGGVSGSPL